MIPEQATPETDAFARFRARREAERAQADATRVSWRRVQPQPSETWTAGGWSGLGPHGCLAYVRPIDGPDDRFEYGYFDDHPSIGRVRVGSRSDLRAAKDAAASALLAYIASRDPEEGTS